MSKIRLFVNKKAFVHKPFELIDTQTGEAEQHYLNLRTELTDAEYTRLEESMIESISAEERGSGGGTDAGNKTVANLKLAMAEAGLVQLATWIVSWSFTNERGAPVPTSKHFLEDLPKDVARIIRDIIAEHAADLITNKRVMTRSEWERRLAEEQGEPLDEGESTDKGLNPFDGSLSLSETSGGSSEATTLTDSGTPSPELSDSTIS